MAFVPLNKRNKPRRVYVCDELWNKLKSVCAREGSNISRWFRGEAQKKVLLGTAVASFGLVMGGILLMPKFTGNSSYSDFTENPGKNAITQDSPELVKKNRSFFTTQKEAQTFFEEFNATWLDKDGDRLACEALKSK